MLQQQTFFQTFLALFQPTGGRGFAFSMTQNDADGVTEDGNTVVMLR